MKNASRTIAVGLALWTGAVFADAPEVTPYRPTVSNPATLSAPGLLELEAGMARSHDDSGTRLFSVPYLFKYAFTENFGVLLGGDAYLHQNDADGNPLTGVGDTVAEIKLRHELTDNMALGLETGVRFPTAKTGLGAEKSDYMVNGIFSAGTGGLNFDVNLVYTLLGSVGPAEGRGEIDWATAVSGKLGGPWGWAAELSGTGQRGTSSTTQALAALSYQPSRTLIFDFGLSRDLNSHTDETTFFAGFVILFDHH
jgi:hypothetical protein